MKILRSKHNKLLWKNNRTIKQVSPALRDLTILYEDTKTEKANVFHIKTNSSQSLEILGGHTYDQRIGRGPRKIHSCLNRTLQNSVRSIYIHNLLVLEDSEATSKLFAIQNLQKKKVAGVLVVPQPLQPGYSFTFQGKGRRGYETLKTFAIKEGDPINEGVFL